VALKIVVPEGRDAIGDFLLFPERVYAERPVRWPTVTDLELPMLLGEGPFVVDRATRPFAAEDGGEIVARILAVVDGRYRRRWGEPLGHLTMFEALPGAREATRRLMDEACEWLREQGLEAARAGFGVLEAPFVADDYDSLPPVIARHNPAYYHALLKDAGFETEKGWVDYKIEVTPELVDRWEHMLAGAEQAGFRVLSMSDVPEDRRVADFTAIWEHAFARHWGYSPSSEAEWQELFDFIGPMGAYDISVLAYRDDEPVGGIFGLPDLSMIATVAEGRELSGAERLNMLGIGVHESARGRGVNLAVAAKSYLELVKRGSTHVSYTLVLDDNWPSRRTGEKLGASVCANFLVYRRTFG
jgi:hypothetical protein